ncbi:MAG: UDP-N-acetylmuramoyl-L-alanine--D-glutamate ligase [Candidatus Omnitrophica bacterium]|nr:UDP-N-acetylmuramoyl-L-alanine--D-glutamate ligase [Candidatus Omnitrophota bacterium]
MLDLTDKTVTVVGAGRSGLALVRLVRRIKGEPRLTDRRPAEDIPDHDLSALHEQGIVTEFGGHTRDFLDGSHMLVLSPGVPFTSEIVQWAREMSVPVMGEIEFAYQFCQAPVIAVTGSNGKTTVVNLITRVLQEAGISARLCGNVGYPFSDYCRDGQDYGYYVLELSSFQLESLLSPGDPLVRSQAARGFRPKIGVILNFSENHLDRHADLDEYFAAKWRLFQNQREEDYAVLNEGCARSRERAGELKARTRFFSAGQDDPERAGNPNHAVVRLIASILNIHPGVIDSVLEAFEGVEHRMELVRSLHGVTYINDSKSTTAESGRWALSQLPGPVIMICGGRDKNIEFSPLRELVRLRVKSMYVIGEASDKLRDTFAQVVPVSVCPDLRQAVNRARDEAAAGDSVLLSPMCASFDMFANFEQRGAIYKQIVMELS